MYLSTSLILALALAAPLATQPKQDAAPKASETNEARVNWDGEWSLIPDESDKVDALIEEHVKDLNFAKKIIWKKKLQKACMAWQALDILYGLDGFSVTLGKERPASSAPDGTASEWTRSDGEKFQVSLRKDGPRMTQTFQGDGYTLTQDYSMRRNGKSLAIQVTYTHKDLANPFTYKLVFKRSV